MAIVAPEHVLAGALLVLINAGHAGAPPADQLQAAVLASQGTGSETLRENVMFGSAAREAIAFAARVVQQSGGTELGALEIALGTIASGEVNPMFYSTLGMERAGLVEALEIVD